MATYATPQEMAGLQYLSPSEMHAYLNWPNTPEGQAAAYKLQSFKEGGRPVSGGAQGAGGPGSARDVTSDLSSGGGGGGGGGQVSQSGIPDAVVRQNLISKAISNIQANTPRLDALSQVNQLLQSFAPSAAYADSAVLADRNIRKALEAFAPGMTRGMQAAGQSGSSMQALMSQRAAENAAEQAAALQAQQKTAYGNIATNLSSVLESLTRFDPAQQELQLKAADLLKTSSSMPSSMAGGTTGTGMSSRPAGGGGGMAGSGVYSAGATNEKARTVGLGGSSSPVANPNLTADYKNIAGAQFQPQLNPTALIEGSPQVGYYKAPPARITFG